MQLTRGVKQVLRVPRTIFLAPTTSTTRQLATAAAVNPKTEQWDEEYRKARPYSEIPGPSVWELFKWFRPGGALDGKDFIAVQDAFVNKYGKICRLPGQLGKPDFVMITDPDDMELVYRNEGQFPVREGFETMNYHRKLLRKDVYKKYVGLATSQGEEWWEFRHKVNPILMQPKATKVYVPKIDEISTDFVQKILAKKDAEDRLSDEFLNLLSKWALESVCYISMDTRIGLLGDQPNPEAEKFMQSVKMFFHYAFQLDILPSIWRFYKTPMFKECMKNNDAVVDGALYFLNEGKKALAEKKKNNLHSDSETGVFEKLLAIDEDVALIMTMDSIIAGVDTTGSAFFKLLYTLALNPEKQEILRKEILSVLPDPETKLTADNMKNMSYLRASMKESTRLSPLFNMVRSAGRDMVLQGYQIPKRTNLNLVSHMHLRSDKYYERSSEFLPERFLRTKSGEEAPSGCPRSAKEAHPFILLPFGFGPRMCIGRRFAELEIEVLTTRLLRHFRVEWRGPPPTYMNSFSQLPIGKTHFVFKKL